MFTVSFKYIRNRISEYQKDDLLEYCYSLLDNEKDKNFPIWFVFILMKWTLIYGGKKYPPKQLNQDKFNKLYATISNLSDDHISDFFKKKQIDKAFLILYNQQFYLKKVVYKEIFATQLKLFSTLKSKYDIEKSFKEKTGFSIFNFLYIEQILWIYINSSQMKDSNLFFDGFLDNHFLKLVADITSVDNVTSYLRLLTLNPSKATESIASFKHKINKEDLQTMEMTFFTMFPFMIYKNRIKLVHPDVFNHSVNYYIYDFLKSNDNSFTTEFGHRLEKYIEFGLKELKLKYQTEAQLKKILPPKSNLTDFLIVEENIFIESKASELQALPSVNPTDELLYNSLRTSLFKAYFKQLIPVSKIINPDKENWGIIITYKEFFWSNFSKLFDIGKDKYGGNNSFNHLPPENVFIIDIYTWDRIIQIVKNKKATLLEILKTAKLNNSKPETTKMLFNMHLEIYDQGKMNLDYLQQEIAKFEL